MSSSNIPDKQRALILQGGGALGAYDAGVIQVLIEELPKIDALKNETARPLFDIIAGTSSGAINAALLAIFYRDNGTWKGAGDSVAKYWTGGSFNIDKDIAFQTRWWDEEHRGDSMAASSEAARRYFSAKHFLLEGAPGIFSRPEPQPDNRFFDYGSLPNNIWYQSKNDGLRETLGKLGFPIKNTIEEPRLLLVATDVQDGATVTFDSYSTQSEIGRYRKEEESDVQRKRLLHYDKGIMPEHVLASASVPLFYKFEKIGDEELCDGGVLSNTPLREVLHAHRDYWYKVIGHSNPEAKVPALEVIIVSVWPRAENASETVPTDYDGIKGRLYDIQLSDKTEYDEKTSMLISDLVGMINEVKARALTSIKNEQERRDFLSRYDQLLQSKAKSRGRDGKTRNYLDVIGGRVGLAEEIVRIECKSDIDSISNKFFDLSERSMERLIAQGKEDAEKAMEYVRNKIKEH